MLDRGGRDAAAPVLGLRANWRQFVLLVAINAFVGGMVGLERSVLPLLARDEFGIASMTAAVAFVASFGGTKALTNLLAGRLSERFTRRRVLVAGWLFGVPVPLLIMWAPAWGWVIAANGLLGINQGLTWSMTVNMKIDLVGPARRGLALGLNESAGYLSVAAAAFLAGVIADSRGLRPEPFYLGIVFAAAGLALSALFVRDTRRFVVHEASGHGPVPIAPSLRTSFAETTWRQRQLFGLSQAGFVNNLNDGLAWGIFPIYFAQAGVSLGRIAALAAVYPLVWGGLQIGTGWLSDIVGRKPLITIGMTVQAVAILGVSLARSFAPWLVMLAALGLGTALVYPTLLAAVGDAVHPGARATTLGVYRFWRDSGAMAGALLAGAVADLASLDAAIVLVAAITGASAVVAGFALSGRRAPRAQSLKEALP